ncbi:RHS repeat-associated core domain-containing protein [Pseudomonadota bacterium]
MHISITIRLLALVSLLVGSMHVAQAFEVQFPDGDLVHRSEDLRVKVLGGHVVINRAWTAEDINEGKWRWQINEAWAPLKFERDPITAIVMNATRSRSIYKKSGDGVYTTEGTLGFGIPIYEVKDYYKWSDKYGNWIHYDFSGHITAYGDRNNVQVNFVTGQDGRVREVRDHFNDLVMTLAYTGDKVRRITDRFGRYVEYEWSGDQIRRFRDVLGNYWTYIYSNGLMKSITDPENRTRSVLYSGNRAVQLTDAEGYEWKYSYDFDRVSEEYTVIQTSPVGRVIERLYAKDGRQIKEIHGDRVVWELKRDGDSREIHINERRLKTVYVFDANRNIRKISYPDGVSTSTNYEPKFSNPIEYVDEVGVKTTWEYDERGNVIRLVEAVGRPEQRVTEFIPDEYGQTQTRTIKGYLGASDATTTWIYDRYGNLDIESDPLGNTYEYDYDVIGNLTIAINPRGKIINISRKLSGWIEKVFDSLGYLRSFAYDRVGNLTSYHDEEGNEWKFLFNKNNWPVTSIDPSLATSSIYYDKDGLVNQTSDPLGRGITFQYDQDRRLVQLLDAAGDATKFEFGKLEQGNSGELTLIEFPAFSTSIKYDLRGRITSSTESFVDPITSELHTGRYKLAYDPRELITSISNEVGETNHFKYDALGRLVRHLDASGSVTSFQYDSRDNLLSVEDSRGGRYTFIYDISDRLRSETKPLGHIVKYEYDQNGSLEKITDAKGQYLKIEHNDRDEIVSKKFFTSTSEIPEIQIDYEYTPRGLLGSYTQLGEITINGTYKYDALDRLINKSTRYEKENLVLDFSIKHEYLSNGLLWKTILPGGPLTVEYTYGTGNELRHIDFDWQRISFDDYSWGIPRQITYGGTVYTRLFDGWGRLRKQLVKSIGSGTVDSPEGPTILDRMYVYNEAGYLSDKVTLQGSYTYKYDQLGRLITSIPPESLKMGQAEKFLPEESYEYDQVHNRIRSAHQLGNWIYDANNLLKEFGINEERILFHYDENGSLTESITALGELSQFQYDTRGRLVEFTAENINSRYGYDPFSRRIYKSANGNETWFFYSGQNLVAEANSGGEITKQYIHKTNQKRMLDSSPISRLDGPESTPNHLFFISDHLETPQIVLDSSSNVEWSKIAESFGKSQITEGSKIEQNIRFPGQYYDQESGLHYNYFRYYSPELGRYIQSDPIGLAGGVNAYAYVGGNPANYSDSMGLVVDTVADAGFILYDFYRIGADNIFNDCGNFGENITALSADVGGLFIPFVSGLGPASRTLRTGKRLKSLRFPSWKKIAIDMNEVLIGHTRGGKKFIQSGRWRDIFPDNMSAKQIEKVIRDAYKNSTQVKRTSRQGNRIKLRGNNIEMWFNPSTNTIETAYPFERFPAIR